MAKTAKKTVSKAKPETKKASSTKKAAPKKSKVITEDLLEKIVIQSLEKLESLNVEHQLQSEIRWCIGSYRHDKNPVGLFEMAGKSLGVLEAAKSKNAKAVPAKLIADLKKVAGK